MTASLSINRIDRHFVGRTILAAALCLPLAACGTSLNAQVVASDNALQAAATAALNAHNQGLIKSGTPLEQDIDIALKGGQAALDNARKAIDAGQTDTVGLYLGEAAAAIGQVGMDITKAQGGAQ